MKYLYRVLIFIVILIFAYWYSLMFATTLINTNGIYKDINSMHETCLLGCGDNNIPLPRGSNYYIGSSTTVGNCLMTFWSLTHVWLHFVFGLLFPNAFKWSLLLGVTFELYEKYVYDCHDTLDIFWNSLGFLLGKGLNWCALN